MRRKNDKISIIEEQTRALLQDARGAMSEKKKTKKRRRTTEESMTSTEFDSPLSFQNDLSGLLQPVQGDSLKILENIEQLEPKSEKKDPLNILENLEEHETKSEDDTLQAETENTSYVLSQSSSQLNENEVETLNEPTTLNESKINEENLLSLVQAHANDASNDALELDDDFWHSNAPYHQVKKKKVLKVKRKKRSSKVQKAEQHVAERETRNQSKVPATNLKLQENIKFAEEELEDRELNFSSEIHRVGLELDDFIPSVENTTSDYQAQKLRIEEQEEAEKLKNMALMEIEENKQTRKAAAKANRSATIIQNMFRVFFARSIATKVREIGSYRAYLESKSIQYYWRQVCDPETGDTWYYNPATGESAWELPLELGILRRASDENKLRVGTHSSHSVRSSSLPDTVSSTRFPPLSPTRTSTSDSFKTRPTTHDAIRSGIITPAADFQANLPRIYSATREDDIEYFNQDSDDDDKEEETHISKFSTHWVNQKLQDTSDSISEVSSEWTDQSETPRFFLPDGSTNIKLRETVRHALKQNKFDSVSSLMVEMAKDASKARTKSKKDRKVALGKTGEKINDLDLNEAVVRCANLNLQSAPMVGMIKVKKRQPKSPNQEVEGFEVLSPKHPPALFEVKHAGNTASDMNELAQLAPTGSSAETCFMCWSAGDDVVKHCDMHERQPIDRPGGVLTCANWDVVTLLRKYRSEEIQETFAKAGASLRWDLNKKRFITIVEPKHQIYRAVAEVLGGFNLKMRSRVKTWKWFKSVSDQIQVGKLKGNKAQSRCNILKAKDTIMHNREIRKFKETVCLLEPQPTATMDDIILAGKGSIDLGYVVLHREAEGVASRRIHFVMAPISKPFILYQPREYSNIPVPREVKVPAPSYAFTADEDMKRMQHKIPGVIADDPWAADDAVTIAAAVSKGTTVNVFMNMNLVGSWLERIASHTAQSTIEKTIKEVRDCVPQISQYRTKHPIPTTNKFATFRRLEIPNSERNKMRGLPPAMAQLSQEVTTVVTAQYGKFVVTSKSSIAPTKHQYETFHDEDGIIDHSLTFKSFQTPNESSLGETYSPLVSNLNTRRPPGISCSSFVNEILEFEKDHARNTLETSLKQKFKQEQITKAEYHSILESYSKSEYTQGDQRMMHYHGNNRTSQTGEKEDTGFRTVCSVPGPPCEPELDTVEFVPSSDIAIPNTPGISGAITTHAGIDYPFCIPTTRELSLLDHFHLLISYLCHGNSACCFTNLGRQDPGMYLMHGYPNASLGSFEMRIYRSFAYYQTPHIEEYKTAEGVPYWYNKKTGETFWESPLFEFDVSVEDDQERVLVEDVLKPMTKYEKKKHSTTLGAKRVPPTQNKMRQHVLRDYEEEPSEEMDKGEDEFSRELAKADDKKKAQEKRYRERIGQAHVLKSSTPLQAVLDTDTHYENATMTKKKKRSSKKKSSKRKTSEIKPTPKKEADIAATDETTTLISNITSALQSVMKSENGSQFSSDDLLKLGMSLGMGIGLGQKQMARKIEQVDQVEKIENDETEISEEIEIPEETDDESSSNSSSEDDEDLLAVTTPRHADSRILPTSTPDETMPNMDNPKTHPPAGEGTYWTATGTAKEKSKGKLLSTKVALPEGFVNSVYKPHTAKQYADYLPTMPNLNEAKPVGVVKPRNILKDWSHTGFDPWSNGKDKYATSFIPSLFIDEATGVDLSAGQHADKNGLQEQRAEVAEKQKLADDMDQLFSWCRHGKYEEIETFFEDPDCNFPINSKDGLGNTLLSVAAQNGNKRISKLCLRNGSEINTQNLNGQSLLHYCIAYGFESLAEYFMQKGADDSLVNADGLTCYEGLSIENVEGL